MGTSERERQGIGLWRGIASPGATVQLGENKFGIIPDKRKVEQTALIIFTFLFKAPGR